MDTDESAQSILNGFLALNDTQSRRNVYQGILNALTSSELREVKSQTSELDFKCDILSRLPWEIKCLVAQYLNLGDIFVLRRVSKKWKEILSSLPVLQSKTKAIPGNHSALSLPETVAGLEAMIKRRWRMEHGKPAAVAKLSSFLDIDSYAQGNFGYSNGMIAWLVNDGDDFFYLLFLRTGEIKRFTTENRESLTRVQVSTVFVTAVSTRGYCHVWSAQTEQHQAFRLPSSNFLRFMVNGTNVVFHYPNQIIHFCFLSGLARTVNVQGFILTMSLHASESQISVICVQEKEGKPLSEGEVNDGEWKEYQLQVMKFLLQGNEFQCFSLQHHDFSSFVSLQEVWDVRFEHNILSYADNSSFTLSMSREVPSGHPKTNETVYFSLEADNTVAAHWVPWLGWDLCSPWYLDLDLAYTQEQPGLDEVDIVFEKQIIPSVPGAVMYRLDFTSGPRKVYVPNVSRPLGVWEIRGDDQFVVFLTKGGTFVWSFDETWKPPGGVMSLL